MVKPFLHQWLVVGTIQLPIKQMMVKPFLGQQLVEVTYHILGDEALPVSITYHILDGEAFSVIIVSCYESDEHRMI